MNVLFRDSSLRIRLAVCSACRGERFLIFKIAAPDGGHQHVQCAACGTTFCDGSCGDAAAIDFGDGESPEEPHYDRRSNTLYIPGRGHFAGLEQTARYIIADTSRMGGAKAIFCTNCRLVSYNRNDVAQRYCGACHRFLGDTP
jgi:hypothetical protein